MANRRFANVGDVLKHFAVAAALETGRPNLYLESHGGSAIYSIADAEPKLLDARFLTELAGADRTGVLESSSYFRLARKRLGEGKYPGSPALALAIRGREAAYRFWDIDGESRADIVAMAEAEGLTDLVEVRAGDGLIGVQRAPADPASLTLLDPYGVWERRDDGPSTCEAAEVMAKRGQPFMLWYHDIDLTRRVSWPGRLRAKIPVDLFQAELRLSGKAATRAGLPVCGIVAANCGGDTLTALSNVLHALGEAIEMVGGRAGFPGSTMTMQLLT